MAILSEWSDYIKTQTLADSLEIVESETVPAAQRWKVEVDRTA